ncbi:T9SS sorting signal type C domain-containing protein [Flavobacterium sp. 9]|uniref:glycine-rich domain-containing protein n=1 Tax=Flavobacterium sp. 9 TaxID=2035198 RepID=UPI000C17EECE|nr:T9SS sorting signal type C domain-containing protein [Flavobacterium sp. 9]
MFLINFISSAQTTTQTITATGSGSFVIPCGVSSITVETWGGGGAGGGSTSSTALGGGGGAGGTYASSIITVSSGQSISYSVGAGAPAATAVGARGGDTWFVNNTTLLAKGGNGGTAPNYTTVAGGLGTTTGSIGSTLVKGADGSNATLTQGGAGGRGGNNGGVGGAARSNSGNGGDGNSGSQPGGGGGGAYVGNGTDRYGGSGGNGQIKITYNTPPVLTVSNAGPDQYKNTTFTLGANTPGTGNTGTWSIVSGPSLSTSQFASGDTSNPTSVFTPSGAGTWTLNWTITNGCGTSVDQVVISNCVTNLITNGDFTGGATSWTPAINSKGPVSGTSYVEVLNEKIYFNNNNDDNTAELDSQASLGQTVAVIPNVQYTLNFLYARRPGSPATVAVDVRVYEGGSITASKNITTSDTNSTPQIGTLTFTPTSSSIVLEFFNSLGGTSTLGSIIDNIVLVPSTQVVPIAITNPKGSYKTLTVCVGGSAGLDVDNISVSGVTYSWSTPSSGTSLVAGTTTKNPSVTFTQTGMKEFKVLATNSSGCGNVYSSTFVYVIDLPTVYNVTGGGPYCSGGTGVLVGLDGSDAVSSTSNISYQLQRDGVDVAGAVVTGTGSAISFGLQTVAGTYTVVAKNTLVTTACSSNMNGSPVISISTPPTVSITGSSNICVNGTTKLSPTSGGNWVSNNPLIASVANNGDVVGLATGTATFSFTSGTAPNCSATTAAVTVSSSTIVFDSSGSYTIPAGVTNIQVECWGAGGGGGGASNNPSAGGGGAGGSYVKNASFTVTPNSTYTINVGTGGTVSTTATGGTGGSSWFGSATTILAVGGRGGVVGNNTTNNGTGGTAVSTGNVGGTTTSAYGAAGGSANLTGASRIAGSGSAGANGGAIAAGTITNGKGADGNAPGGGGAGGRNTNGTNSSGGIGGMGRVTITLPTPTATAGGSTTICQTGTALVSGANATNGTILWSHNGTGSLTNATTLTPTYAAASGDAGNAVVLTMTVSNGPCLVATAIYTVNVTALSTANAGGVLPAICQGGTSQAMGGSVGGGATSGVWTGGSGSWANVNNPSTATYTASASESGSITLTLTTNAGSCGAVTVTKTITVNKLSTANAGGVLPAICQGGTSQAMGGSVGGGATSGVWTGGSGSWANANNPSTATYTASASESGSITLTLTTNAGSCGAVTVTKTITVNQLSTANAGGVLPAICQGGTSQAMGGSVGGGATSGVWTGGSGSWANANNPSTATYTASASESGSITLTLTTNAGSCGAVTVTKTITVNQLSTANAGGVLPAICQGGTSQAMGGSVGGGATSGVWTGGSGSWANANNPSTATYTASASESGSITLTLTTNAGSCGAVTVTKTITVNQLSTANAGGVLPAICQGGTSQAMGGSVGGGATSGVWTGGSGSWANANNPSTATYTASASESGSITLTLTTNAGSCGAVTVTKTITVNQLSTANAGGVLPAICQGGTSQAMGGSVGGGATSGVWTGGSGSWANANNPSTATYTASASESGSITLTLTTNAGSCGAVTVTKTITVNQLSTANAGGVLPAICQGGTSQAMGGSVGGGATSGVWTGGSGSWANANNPSTATYTASASESGSITLTLTTNAGSCGAVTVTKTITVNQLSTANAGGVLPAICQGGTSQAMGGSVGGGATSGVWTGGSGSWANANNPSNATYTASASESGSITLTLTTNAGSCGAVTVTKTITVNQLSTANAGGVLPAICQGGTSQAMGGSVGGGATSGVWTGGSGSWANANNPSTATYTASASESGSITLTLTTNAGSCGAVTTTKLITVNALPGTPSPGTPTQPTCASPVGSVLLSNLPSSGTWTITQSGSAPGSYNGTGITYNVQNLAPGNYTFTVVGAANSCSSLASTNVTINVSSSKVWTGNTNGNWNNPANWNPSGIPLPSDCVVIPDASTVLNVPSIQGTGIVADAFTLNVNDNASLTVDSKNTLKVVGSVTVASLGSLVFKDEASLVQTTNATNTGNITYYRNTEPVRRYDFTYWSTPITNTVTPYKLKDLSPGTLLDKYQSYNSTTSLWDIHLNGLKDMEPAVGYAVRAPQTFSITAPTVYPAVFTGTPNNGDYSVAIYGAKWSLIGNPYPSAIDAEKLIKINHDASPSVDIGSLYFWTHNSPPSGTPSAGGSYDYTSNDYAVFNLSGSTGTGPTPPPTGDIAACQSFFMLASAPGVVKFTNDMRVDGRNEQFFKTAKTNAIEKNRVWLNLTSNQGAFKQVLVGYIEGATNDWDVNYDAATNNGNTFIDFYSINQADKLIIQGRALPFADTDRVPLGYKTTVAGDFIISIDHADGFFNNQAVYLEDKTTGKVTDLKAGNYTFTTAIGTFTDRFTIAYIKKTLGTGDFENLENTIFVSIKDKTIKVNSSKETIKEVTIYDINGQLLYSKKKIDVNELQIPNLQSSNQVLLVKVTLDNGFTTTKKIIFQ